MAELKMAVGIYFDRHWLPGVIVRELRKRAKAGIYDGLPTAANAAYLHSCTGFDERSGTALIFIRDEGDPQWRGPLALFPRCWRLALSFREPVTSKALPLNLAAASEWTQAFFREAREQIVCETKAATMGQQWHHFRLFANDDWAPKPIYPADYPMFHQRGWKSWAEFCAPDNSSEEGGDGAKQGMA